MPTHTAFGCNACGNVDDDPKHQHVLADGTSVLHHHDCGALLDPPCGICAVIHAEAPKTGKKMVTGQAMRDHLTKLPPRKWTQHQDGTFTYEDGTVVDGQAVFESDKRGRTFENVEVAVGEDA